MAQSHSTCGDELANRVEKEGETMSLSSNPSLGESSAFGGGTDAQSLRARVDRLPMATRSHRQWAVVVGFFLFFDIFDLAAFGYAAPAIRADWGISIGQIGLATSTTFLGMFVGALVGGRLSDRYGRQPLIIAGATTFSVASLLTTFVASFELLVPLRFISGVGLQATTGVLLVYISEMFPRHLRGRYLAILMTLATVGGPCAALTARLVVPLGPDGWRWIFAIGALGILGVVVTLRKLPETVHWQATHGRAAQAVDVVERLETEARDVVGPELPPVEPLTPVPPGKLSDLLRKRYVKRTVVATLAMVLLIQGNYGFNTWVPTLLVEYGYAQETALTVATIITLAAVVGAIVPFPIVDRVERKNLVLCLTVVAAAGVVAFGFAPGVVQLVVAGSITMMALQATVVVMYAYLPEVFPTQLRGVGSGLSNGFGRLAGVAGGFIVAGVYSGLGFVAVFAYLALVLLLLGIIMVVGAERTTNRSLE